MSNVQVKNLEPETHQQLRARAAAAGTTISEYVLELIRRDLRAPTRQQWIHATSKLPHHDFTRAEITGAISAGRDRR